MNFGLYNTLKKYIEFKLYEGIETIEGVHEKIVVYYAKDKLTEGEFMSLYNLLYPKVEEAQEVQKIASEVVNKVIIDYQTTSSEDFSYYLEKAPGCMIFIGCTKDKFYPQHSENFTVGENPILIGTQVFYNISKKYLMKIKEDGYEKSIYNNNINDNFNINNMWN